MGGDDLRHRRHDGAGVDPRRMTGRASTITTSVLGEGNPCADGHGERCGGQPERCLNGIPCSTSTTTAAPALLIASVTDDVAPVTGLGGE